MTHSPRPYQLKARDDIRGLLSKKEKRILLQLATGAGKTFCFSMFLKGALEKCTNSILVVKGRALVDQASRRLSEQGIDHSVFMAGDPRYDPSKLIQVVSVDTCRERKHYPNHEEVKLVIIDEAHTATSNTFLDFLSKYEHAIWIPVTATPWTDCGLVSIANSVVYPISIEELMQQGYLVRPKYFAPSVFDSSKIAVSKGEFKDESSIHEFESQAIYGDVVKNYEAKCLGSCTWVFAINIAHAQTLADKFTEAGHNPTVITGKTKLQERIKILDTSDLVISVGTLTTGVDLPRLKNLIICRPTKSKNLYVQMLGRGTRPYPGKENFYVYDHVGNVERFGFIEDETKATLKPKKKVSKKEAEKESSLPSPVRRCPECSTVVKVGLATCPECFFVFPTRVIKESSKSMELLELSDKIEDRIKRRADWHMGIMWAYGNKAGKLWFLLIEDFGEEQIIKHVYLYKTKKSEYESWETKGGVNPFGFYKGWKRYQ